MDWTRGLALCVVAACVAAAGGPALAQSAARDVAVFGSRSAPPVTENGVVVYRGPASPAPAPISAGVATQTAVTAIGGDKLWFIDRDNGRVVGCTLGSNGQVGGKVIRCGDRSLAGISDR